MPINSTKTSPQSSEVVVSNFSEVTGCGCSLDLTSSTSPFLSLCCRERWVRCRGRFDAVPSLGPVILFEQALTLCLQTPLLINRGVFLRSSVRSILDPGWVLFILRTMPFGFLKATSLVDEYEMTKHFDDFFKQSRRHLRLVLELLPHFHLEPIRDHQTYTERILLLTVRK